MFEGSVTISRSIPCSAMARRVLAMRASYSARSKGSAIAVMDTSPALPSSGALDLLAADQARMQRHIDVAAADHHRGHARLSQGAGQQRRDADRAAALDHLLLLEIGVADRGGDLLLADQEQVVDQVA